MFLVHLSTKYYSVVTDATAALSQIFSNEQSLLSLVIPSKPHLWRPVVSHRMLIGLTSMIGNKRFNLKPGKIKNCIVEQKNIENTGIC